jgi:hypothetical protein
MQISQAVWEWRGNRVFVAVARKFGAVVAGDEVKAELIELARTMLPKRRYA